MTVWPKIKIDYVFFYKGTKKLTIGSQSFI